MQQALLGKARALEATDDDRGAWELLSEASVRLPWAVPVLMELARLTLAQQDWEGLMEVVNRLQRVDVNNIMATAYTGIALLVTNQQYLLLLHAPLAHPTESQPCGSYA